MLSLQHSCMHRCLGPESAVCMRAKPFSMVQAAELDAQLQLTTAENVQLEAARAEVTHQLAEAQGAIADLAAEKQALEGSLAATKASLQASEVSTYSGPVNAFFGACPDSTRDGLHMQGIQTAAGFALRIHANMTTSPHILYSSVPLIQPKGKQKSVVCCIKNLKCGTRTILTHEWPFLKR